MKFSLCSSSVFPSSVSIFIAIDLKSYQVNYLSPFCYVPLPQGFILFFPLDHILLSSYFVWLCPFFSMKLSKIVTYADPKGVSLCGSIPMQSACTQWFWWESWIWCERKSCFFSGFASSHQLGRRFGWIWRGRARFRCEPVLPICSVANISHCWSRIHEFSSKLALFSLNISLCPLSTRILAPEWSSARATWAGACTWHGLVHSLPTPCFLMFIFGPVFSDATLITY